MPVNSTQRIATAFRNAAADGKVTDAEANGAIRLASRNLLTGAERKELARQLRLRGDAFEAPAKQRLSRFVNAASKPANTADPRVMVHDRGSLRYRAVQGNLYKNGVSARDVVQGHAGDCYLVSTLASAAKQRPGLITDAITRKSDGSFVVRFYARKADGTAAPVYVPVDRELAGDRAGAHYARGELWVSVMEKAYAKWKGNYETIGNGGSPTDAMFALTGREADWHPTTDGTADALFTEMKQSVAAKKLVVASTRTGSQYNGTGVVPSHAYTVMGLSEKNGVRYVELRNPWGKTEPGQPNGGDGVFRLSLSKFVKLFPDLFTSA